MFGLTTSQGSRDGEVGVRKNLFPALLVEIDPLENKVGVHE